MAKAARALCDSCESKVVAGASFCGRCGAPTSWASHSERTAWEVAQYRHKTANVPIGVAYEQAPAPQAPAKSRGVVRMFSRRAHVPGRPQAEAQRAAPPVAERAPEPRAKLASRSKQAAAKRSNADAEPLHDTPATVLAMRLLNARVAELDARVQELAHELSATRDAKPRRWYRL